MKTRIVRAGRTAGHESLRFLAICCILLFAILNKASDLSDAASYLFRLSACSRIRNASHSGVPDNQFIIT